MKIGGRVRGRGGFCRTRCRAFTLLEVLIALVIVAVALAALARAGAQAIDGQSMLEERTLALWVADNVLAELRLEAAPASGRRQGQRRMGDRDWYWQALIQPAPGDDLIRVDVAVHASARHETPILTHTGFLPR
ncbi:MAG: type II secretion system protein GspI [Wenzhouxiangella sp.]|nr:MAG: type II secretion system protein GspI [Wenzhouxiangella sp.]